MKTRTKLILGCVLLLLVLLFLVVKGASSRNQRKAKDTKAVQSEEPSGYTYDEYGNKIWLGDPKISSEDVVYGYFKSLSLLDFNATSKYMSVDSQVMTGFIEKNEDSDSGDEIASNFTHKIYKLVLQSLLVDSIVDTAILPEGIIYTVRVKHLDLTNSEFWLKDKDKIFKDLSIYYSDNVQGTENKCDEYLSNYIKTCCENKTIGTKESEVELTLNKTSNDSWLISDDNSLSELCDYNNGDYVIESIRVAFEDWYEKQDIEY